MKSIVFALFVALSAFKQILSQTFELNILHMNDHHSHIAPERFTLRGGTGGVPPDLPPVTVSYGGFPRLVTLFDQITTGSENVLKLHAGDATVGTLYYTLFKGKADAALMNQVCFDAFALGNHEFDFGEETLASFLDLLSGSSCSNPISVLSANTKVANDSPLSGKFQAYAIKDYNGEKVGIIGLTTLITTVSSTPSKETVFSDLVAATEAAVAELIQAGVNKIVALTHIGYTLDLNEIAQIEGIDVVVGGHTHSLLSDITFLASNTGSYPAEVTKDNGDKACVVQAWEHGHGLGAMQVVFDADGKVQSCDGGTLFPFDSNSYVNTTMAYDPKVDTAFTADITSYLDSTVVFRNVEANAAAQSIFESFDENVDTLKQQVIANVPTGICYERVPGLGRSKICNRVETLAQGGGACNVVAKAFLFQINEPSIVSQNGGGCREDIKAGPYTFADAYSMLPFANDLVLMSMTGAQIILVLNQAMQNALSGISTGSYPYAAGLRFDVDANARSPNYLSNVEVNLSLQGEWMPINENETYRVVTNSFLAGGRDGYSEFKNVPDQIPLKLEYATAFIKYLEAVDVLEDLPRSDYSTQSFTPINSAIFTESFDMEPMFLKPFRVGNQAIVASVPGRSYQGSGYAILRRGGPRASLRSSIVPFSFPNSIYEIKFWFRWQLLDPTGVLTVFLRLGRGEKWTPVSVIDQVGEYSSKGWQQFSLLLTLNNPELAVRVQLDGGARNVRDKVAIDEFSFDKVAVLHN